MAKKKSLAIVKNGMQPESTKTPIQELDEWLKEKNYTIVQVIITPSGEVVSIQNVIMPELLNAGWKPGFQIVEKK